MLFALVLSFLGCASLDQKIDHTVKLRSIGRDGVVDLEYTYGSVGPRRSKYLGVAGTLMAAEMEVPQEFLINWTTENDGRRHKLVIPLKHLLGKRDVTKKVVTVEIEGAKLKLLLVTRSGHQTVDRTLIFEN